MTPHSLQSAAVPDRYVSRLTHSEGRTRGRRSQSLESESHSNKLHSISPSSLLVLASLFIPKCLFHFSFFIYISPSSLFNSSGACFSLLPPSRPLNFSAFNFSLHPTISPLSCFFFFFFPSPTLHIFSSQNRVRLGRFFFFLSLSHECSL